jgi:hypothetical protein
MRHFSNNCCIYAFSARHSPYHRHKHQHQELAAGPGAVLPLASNGQGGLGEPGDDRKDRGEVLAQFADAFAPVIKLLIDVLCRAHSTATDTLRRYGGDGRSGQGY